MPSHGSVTARGSRRDPRHGISSRSGGHTRRSRPKARPAALPDFHVSLNATWEGPVSTAASSAGWPATVPPFDHHLTLETGSARLALEGELDLVAEPQLAALLDRCTRDAALVVADLSALEFLSCGALRLLITASQRTRAMGGRFVVVRGQAAVQRLFELIGVDLALELVDVPPERSRLPRSWRRNEGAAILPRR